MPLDGLGFEDQTARAVATRRWRHRLLPRNPCPSARQSTSDTPVPSPPPTPPWICRSVRLSVCPSVRLRSSPCSAVALDQGVGFVGSPGAGFVEGETGDVLGGPVVEDRL